MNIDQVIKKAIEGGWEPQRATGEFAFKHLYKKDKWFENLEPFLADMYLDPLFWHSLGKALGWADEKFYQYDAVHSHIGERMPEWKWYTRHFMNEIMEGKTPEQFFETLQ